MAMRPIAPDDIDPESEYQCADCHDLASAGPSQQRLRTHPRLRRAQRRIRVETDQVSTCIWPDTGYGSASRSWLRTKGASTSFTAWAKDGGVTAYRPDRRGGARSFRPGWCCPAASPGKNGNPVKVRSVPAACRIARAVWRAQHTPSAMDMPPPPCMGCLGEPPRIGAP